MSYKFKGRLYHSHEAYQRALQEDQMRSSRSQVSALRGEMDRQRSQIRDAQNAHRRAQGNYQEQLRANQQLEGHVSDLRRTQQQLRSTQAAMQRQVDQEFVSVRRQAQEMCEEIELTQEQLAQLEREHHAHARLVEQQFSELEAELQEGLDEAQRDRDRIRQELQQEVARLDSEIEHDRQERLRKACSESDRAASQIAIVEELLEPCEEKEEQLNLRRQIGPIREELVMARRRLDEGSTEAALAVSSDMFAKARALHHEVPRCEAELEARRQHVLDTVTHLKEGLNDQTIQRYFASDCTTADAALDRIRERSERGYEKYSRLEIESERDERDLDKLSTEVLTITASAPIVRQMVIDRNRRADALLTRLRQELGPETRDPDARYSGKDDPKSDLIVEADFGGATVTLALPLEPTEPIEVIGHRHDSNEACAAYMSKVLRVLREEMQVFDERRDLSNPQEANLEQRAGTRGWEDTSRNLEEIYRRT